MTAGDSRALPRVKICGICRYEDARLALDEGAWALGLIFHRPSPRSIEPDRARDLVQRLPRDTLTIGVFVDRSPRDVQAIVDSVGLAGVQLHGSESPADLRAIRADLRLKAFRVGPDFDASVVDRYPDALVLLDTYRPGQEGGTGVTFDWSLARYVASRRQVVLSGGLGPDNVVAALTELRPYALDVSSRLESAPGKKSPERLRELFARLRRATGPEGKG